jgi:hypothetical protein
MGDLVACVCKERQVAPIGVAAMLALRTRGDAGDCPRQYRSSDSRRVSLCRLRGLWCSLLSSHARKVQCVASLHSLLGAVPRCGRPLTANKKGGVGDGDGVYSNQDWVSSSSAHTSCTQRCCRELRVRQCVMAQGGGWHCRRNVGWRT